MSVSKVTQNKLEEKLAEFETVLELLEDTLGDDDARVSRVQKNADQLEDKFMTLSTVYKASYRREALDKVTEEEFNSEDKEAGTKFQYNDAWLKGVKKKLSSAIAKADEKLARCL